jgi:hypothetical protein
LRLNSRQSLLDRDRRLLLLFDPFLCEKEKKISMRYEFIAFIIFDSEPRTPFLCFFARLFVNSIINTYHSTPFDEFSIVYLCVSCFDFDRRGVTAHDGVR